jgi:acetyltransferase-like isoleucine patch superfamily enzyme
MIAAVVDSGRRSADRFSCRGRELGFWLERFFPFCRFLSLPQRGLGFDHVLVFSLSRFPEISDACSRKLRVWLRNHTASTREMYAPEGKPFFIASRSFLKAKGITLKQGIFNELRSISGVASLALRDPVPVFDARREPQRIEAAVTALQVRLLKRRGVAIENLGNIFLEGLPAIGRGSLIGTGVTIKGDCRIGRRVTLYANCFIENSRIGDGCVILPGSVIRDSILEKDVQLGPYCHLRNGSLVRRGAKMGNFVEMKKSVLGRGSKAMHLSYIGDAHVGMKVNIGAGTITCNYDGVKKNPTRIGDNVFIGSGTELVAPVTIHSDSYVGAGSTITEDVPRHALAVARQRQKNIAGWVLRKRKKTKHPRP